MQKYHSGAALLRNWFVDYSGGGASTRQGTRYINTCGAPGARLISFQPSTTLSYVLEFGQNYIRFYSNGQTILSGGVPYQISTPYNASDLFPNPATGNPGIKFVQDVTSLIICHPNYAPMILTIISANNWQLTAITFGPSVNAPVALANGSGSGTTLGAGSWNYSYLVTALDSGNQESGPSNPVSFTSLLLLNTTPGTMTISWNAVPGAASYNVYKVSPTFNPATVLAGTQYGYIGNTTGTSFTDSYPGIDPDFSQTPPVPQNPIVGGSVLTLTLTGNADYTSVPGVSIAAAPAGGYAATGYASLVAYAVGIAGGGTLANLSNPDASPIGQPITLSNGVVLEITAAEDEGIGAWTITGLSIVSGGSITSGSTPSNPIHIVTANLSNGWEVYDEPSHEPTVNLTWHIGSLILIQGGYDYASAPGVTFSSGAATASTTISPIAGGGGLGNPGVPTFFQERLVLAAVSTAIQTYQMSQPGSFFNFDISNPSEPDDAIIGTIISEQLNDIRWAISVPSGLLLGTGKGAWLVNGGGGLSTLNPITPSNQTANPQAFNGANDLRPIKINFDLLYGTNKGNYVRDMTYNIYANIFTGNDISVLSNHLFFGYYMTDWAWSEEPFKTLWCVRGDGQMLSLGFVKEQDLIGWAHHDTNGQFQSVCTVIENVGGNIVDAIYVIVQRYINGAFVSYVERMADRYFPYGYEDAWSVDCALQTAPQASPTGTLNITGNASVIGNAVTLTDTADAPFTSGMVGWVVRAGGGIYTISSYTSTSVVSATVKRVPSAINPYTFIPYPVINGYTIWEPITTITGLIQLIGQTVTGVADGAVVPPSVVSGGGSIVLSTPASKVTLGLAYLPQLQTLPLDLGEPTVQGKRKKITGVTLRVADTLGLQIGTSFANAVTMKDFQLGSVGTQSNQVVTDLVNGDGRTIMDQAWQEAGNYCIQQNLPYPATVLGAMPEVVVGDTAR